MGTVIITGANGSVALRAVEYLLENHPELTAVLTVRNTSETDANTKALRNLIRKYPDAKVSISKLDLGVMDDVQAFADNIIRSINNESLPRVKSVICNAFYWNLLEDVEFTNDGYEKTFQTNHIAHAALVLRLIGYFVPNGGRVVLFSSDAIYPGRNQLEKFPPGIPDDLDILAKPLNKREVGRGFQRYANSKLAITSWAHALNQHLENDPSLRDITCVAINPGNISDSRALRTNTPSTLAMMQRFILGPFMPVLRAIADSSLRTSKTAGQEVMQLALGISHPDERGFFSGLVRDQSSEESMDEIKQERLWIKTLQWARVGQDGTAIRIE